MGSHREHTDTHGRTHAETQRHITYTDTCALTRTGTHRDTETNTVLVARINSKTSLAKYVPKRLLYGWGGRTARTAEHLARVDTMDAHVGVVHHLEERGVAVGAPLGEPHVDAKHGAIARLGDARRLDRVPDLCPDAKTPFTVGTATVRSRW